MQRILNNECLIIQYAKQSIIRMPMIDCLKRRPHWKVIEKHGFLVIGGLIDPIITDSELECLALLHPVHTKNTSDTSYSISNVVCKK